RSILGLDHSWRVALVGAGKIGAALFSYRALQRREFRIESVFDSDPAKVGQQWGALYVQADEELERALAERPVDLAIVAVPAEAAQSVVDRLVRVGVKGVLNFAPVRLRVPEGVALRDVDMAMEMEGLAFALSNG
ncbi:MAG TPA: redox-sensing transcriptional repressor Rex, partial [Longimicrobiaceae bacterium]|nr:redox-sensing transcriptional repressor Rex [Longimicrobiaceae bacterium]